MADDGMLVTYRENALPELRLDVKGLKEAQMSYDNFKEGLRYCSTFFTGRPLLQVSGVLNQAQYQRAIDGEKSLERLAYLGDFQKIKENEEKMNSYNESDRIVTLPYAQQTHPKA